MNRVQNIWKKKKERVTWVLVHYNEYTTVHIEEKEKKSDIGTI